MKVKWLDRRIACPGPYLTLVLSQAECDAAMKACGQPSVKYISEGANATVHLTKDRKGHPAAVVAVGEMNGRNSIEIAGLLIHEAVHVWQEHCSNIGESRPGIEQEAYGIQCIAQELMAEYARRAP